MADEYDDLRDADVFSHFNEESIIARINQVFISSGTKYYAMYLCDDDTTAVDVWHGITRDDSNWIGRCNWLHLLVQLEKCGSSVEVESIVKYSINGD